MGLRVECIERKTEMDENENEVGMSEEEFHVLNKRRYWLIKKKHTGGGLTSKEELELKLLQRLAGRYAGSSAAVDPERLAELKAIHSRLVRELG